MKDEEILMRAVQKAIDNGWDCFGNTFYKTAEDIVYRIGQGEDSYSVEDIIFNRNFAKALWVNATVPESNEIDDNHEELGLYKAEGGGYEGYGDYVMLQFDGEPWQYHLQQMVIADDPIKYLEENI